MGEMAELRVSDGHVLDSYVARPAGKPAAGLVVIQEIFGLNRHIRAIADSYAADGFLVIAPALFDRVEKGVELGYDGADTPRGMALMRKLATASTLLDIDAALDHARSETGARCGVIGFCFGGLMAWLSAARLRPDAVVGYYAGRIGDYADETPRAPVQLHFGRLDTHIPADQVEKVRAAHPEVEINWYDDAGHGFNCDMRSSFHAASAALARARALGFLRSHMG
ncbi:MAG TPA: dienelactone hydrolase family protein [Terracidiphilus sp.]|nr:dienelactone hydrolase family protein [Terracidiphilus sp.]